jgi:hypothetical protein
VNTTIVIRPTIRDAQGPCRVDGDELRVSLVDRTGRSLSVDGAPAVVQFAATSSLGDDLFGWRNWCGSRDVMIVGQLMTGGRGVTAHLQPEILPACLDRSEPSVFLVILR